MRYPGRNIILLHSPSIPIKAAANRPLKTCAYTKSIPFAGNDTILARGQSLPCTPAVVISTNGKPVVGLSNNSIPDPVVNWNEDMQYVLKVSIAEGCVGYDTINIKYYLGPDIYVPNASSPNGDGNNDRFRFIPVGIVSPEFFRIFNRWGQESLLLGRFP